MPAAELTPVQDENSAVEAEEVGHVLVLGDEVFTCGDKLPVTTLIRYADNDMLSLHHILVKLVHPDEHERMWDAFESLDIEEVGESVKELIESYSERPTERPGHSRSGSKKQKRR
jgi:hypothetical protein